MAEVKRVAKTAEAGGITNVAPADPAITITEVKPKPMVEGMEVGDYVPSAEDLARLAKNSAAPFAGQAEPPPEVPHTSTLIAPSRAKQTMAEMERGRVIVEERTKLRERQLAGG